MKSVSQGLNSQRVCIGSGNGMAPTGDKPLPKLMLRNFTAYARHQASMS